MVSAQLLWSISHISSQGRCAFTAADIKVLEPNKSDGAIEKSLQRLCLAGLIGRACRGVYVLIDNGYPDSRVMEELAALLRPGALNYLSFESALAHAGLMPPTPPRIVTVATTGAKGLYNTLWGVVEFTHVDHVALDISAQTAMRPGGYLSVACDALALLDQAALGRNLHLLKQDSKRPLG